MPLWQEVLSALAREFSDLPSAAEITPLVLRSLVSLVLGGAIGYQREKIGKAAGLRTHMLVCLGTALFIAIPQQARLGSEALSRIIQGITSGIGFLGAGAILKDVQRGRIDGLTTAASIWFTAAIGIAVGLGREASAIVGTVLALAVLSLSHRFSPEQPGYQEGPSAGPAPPSPAKEESTSGR